MSQNTKPVSRLPIVFALVILVAFSLFFLIEFIDLSNNDLGVAEEELSEATYMDIVAPLLVNADPVNGAELVELYGCNACHGGSNAGHLAPGHTQVAEVAADRHPPLTAAAYLYESIIYPGAYLVEGYQNNMPRTYADQMPDEDLGDIIAYLLLPEAEKAALHEDSA
ncbi:MAG: hypothetical protein OHK0046_03850 [Anaerolineae bacterium]